MLNVDPTFWKQKRVFLTGHTGFKGSWLSLWLQSMGAELYGLALPSPTAPSLFDEADVEQGMISTIGDIRDYETVRSAMHACQPEIIIHMAAQPLVRYSYDAPIETYATNVMGTVHVLEAARSLESVKAIVNITTDKCYENREWVWGYREDEAMGGFDPYSSSKGCAELVTSAYRRSFFEETGIGLSSVRAGNVIGGGDWAKDRLIPDILKAIDNEKPIIIRNPHSIRPWQHVIEPLSGYLILAEKLYADPIKWSGAWNFGPNDEDAMPVQWIVEHIAKLHSQKATWELDSANNPHEANYLKLDISKVKSALGWHPRWSLATALEKIMEWHDLWSSDQNMQAACINQINEHQNTGLN